MGFYHKAAQLDSFFYSIKNEKGSSTAPLFQMLTPKHTMSDLYLT